MPARRSALICRGPAGLAQKNRRTSTCKWTANRAHGRSPSVRGDLAPTKEHLEVAVGDGRADGHRQPDQATADEPTAVVERDRALTADEADLVVGTVADFGQRLGERAPARRVA